MALAHSPRIVTDGLLFAFDAGNTKSYLGSGFKCNDLIGSNNGTKYGPTFSSDDGGSFSFDGGNDYIDFPNDLSTGTGVSLSFWVNPALDSNRNTFISSGGAGVAVGFAFFANTVDTTDRKLIFKVGNGTSGDSLLSSSNVVLDNVWQNFAVTCVRSTGACVLYKNGSSIASSTLSITDWVMNITDAGFHIGSFVAPQPNSWYYSGKLSIAKVYNKGLTAAEVLQNYNAFKGRYV